MRKPIYKSEKPYQEDINDLIEKTDKKKKVMEEFHQGKLHSGSKKGPKVTDPKQAVAIAYSEERDSKKFKKGIVKAYTEDLNDLVEAEVLAKGGVGSGVKGHTTNRSAFMDKKKNKLVAKEEYLKDTAQGLMGQSGFDDKPGHFMSRKQVVSAISKVTGHSDNASWMILGDMEKEGLIENIGKLFVVMKPRSKEAKVANNMAESHRQMVQTMNQANKKKS